MHAPAVERQPAPVRCLVVEGNAHVRSAIVDAMTMAGIDVAGVAGDTADAFQQLATERLDVMVFNLWAGTEDGIAVVSRVAELAPHLDVVVYSSHASHATASAVLAAGAHAVVIKRPSIDTLVDALHAVRAGRLFVDPLIVDETDYLRQ